MYVHSNSIAVTCARCVNRLLIINTLPSQQSTAAVDIIASYSCIPLPAFSFFSLSLPCSLPPFLSPSLSQTPTPFLRSSVWSACFGGAEDSPAYILLSAFSLLLQQHTHTHSQPSRRRRTQQNTTEQNRQTKQTNKDKYTQCHHYYYYYFKKKWGLLRS